MPLFHIRLEMCPTTITPPPMTPENFEEHFQREYNYTHQVEQMQIMGTQNSNLPLSLRSSQGAVKDMLVELSVLDLPSRYVPTSPLDHVTLTDEAPNKQRHVTRSPSNLHHTSRNHPSTASATGSPASTTSPPEPGSSTTGPPTIAARSSRQQTRTRYPRPSTSSSGRTSSGLQPPREEEEEEEEVIVSSPTEVAATFRHVTEEIKERVDPAIERRPISCPPTSPG